jgi:hypothetical protein
MSQKQAQVELGFTKVQPVESTDRLALPPNSSLTLYLSISYLQRIAANVEDNSSLDCCPFLEEV